MNPYTPPSADPDDSDPDIARPTSGKGTMCLKCGGTNTRPESALKSKPSIIVVIFFGWLFLLIRTAFAKRTELCHDCGATWSYRTTGSRLALAFLVLLVLLIALSLLADGN